MERRTLFAGLAAALAADAAAQAAPAGNVAEGFVAALNAHDIEAFAALFADDYVNHQTSAAAKRPAGIPDKQATKAYFAARLAALPDLRVTADKIVATGEWVCANFSYVGTHTGGALFGVPPGGRAVSFNSCDILRVRDGKIAEHWGAADIAGLLVQLKGG